MKLSTKILTILTPIAVAGTIIPAAVSCSCSKKDYLFDYGNHINCRDKKDGDYHKPEEVKNAARIRALRVEKNYVDVGILDTLNMMWNQPIGQQLFFFDLVASVVITNNEDINLKGWTLDDNSKVSFNLNGTQYSESYLSYFVADDHTVWLKYNDDDSLKYRSYTYYDWILTD